MICSLLCSLRPLFPRVARGLKMLIFQGFRVLKAFKIVLLLYYIIERTLIFRGSFFVL